MYNLLLLLLLLLSVRWLILYSLHSLNLYRMESWIQTITTTKMLALELNSIFHITYISHWMEWFICFTIFFHHISFSFFLQFKIKFHIFSILNGVLTRFFILFLFFALFVSSIRLSTEFHAYEKGQWFNFWNGLFSTQK